MPITLPGGQETQFFTLEKYGGLDTRARRPAIKPEDFYWIENWITIGDGNLRTIYDASATPLYEAANPRTIIYYAFYNISSTRYAIVFLDNGTAVQVNADTGATTTISSTANTFYTAGGTLPHVAQYQSKFLVITSRVSDNAYWIWDGSHLFTAGTLDPQVTIDASGFGYTSAPTVTAYGGTGTGATFSATVANGSVTKIEVTNPGSGYLIGEKVSLVITGGGSDDQARATATVDTTKGGVAIVTVTNGGSKYSSPLVAFSGGGGTGAAAFVSGAANGVITDITVTNPGKDYTSAPTVTITDGGSGTGATAVCEIRRGQITGISVISGGSGFTGVPDVIISAPDDQGFPNIQAEAYATVTAGAVTAITVTRTGVGYRQAKVDLVGGNNAAAASVKLMPYGIKGTSIETYQDRVWVFDDTKYSYTGPDSIADFSSSGGGGSKPVTDANLKEKVVRGFQANGVLYRLADSSINVITNVQVSDTGVTRFNDTNVDPQIGTAWRDTVVALGRAVVFVNPTGVYAIFGGSAEKVSNELDGLFATASFNTGQSGVTPTACVATLFSRRVYCLLMTATDPYTNTLRDLILMWDGQHWFVASQSMAPKILSGQVINSTLTGYGASTTAIHKLYQTPSATLPKVFMTKLAALPNYAIQSQVLRCNYLAQTEEVYTSTLEVTLENEAGRNSPDIRPLAAGEITWVNNSNAECTWVNNLGDPVTWVSRGLVLDLFDASIFGHLIGATVLTTAPDLTMISFELGMRPYAPDQ